MHIQYPSIGYATAIGVSWSTVALRGTVFQLRFIHRTCHWTYSKINGKLSSSELSTECGLGEFANLHSINHHIIIAIIIIIFPVTLPIVRVNNHQQDVQTDRAISPLSHTESTKSRIFIEG